jgi:hypothetical protein
MRALVRASAENSELVLAIRASTFSTTVAIIFSNNYKLNIITMNDTSKTPSTIPPAVSIKMCFTLSRQHKVNDNKCAV